MKHLDGTYDLTVDDIHEIRVENSKKFETMTRDEIKKFYKEKVKKFLETAVLIVVVTIMLFSNMIYADGWVKHQNGYNWLYEEKGVFVKNAWRRIDGINYYFDGDGIWVPSDVAFGITYKTKTNYTFTMYTESDDADNKKHRTVVETAIPIVEGENAVSINNLLNNKLISLINSHILDVFGDNLMYIKKIEVREIDETENKNGITRLTYRGDIVFNLYIDLANLNIWID